MPNSPAVTAVDLLNRYLDDPSKSEQNHQTFARQTLADIALVDAELRPQIVAQLEILTTTGTPAMRSRGRKLIARLAAAAAARC